MKSPEVLCGLALLGAVLFTGSASAAGPKVEVTLEGTGFPTGWTVPDEWMRNRVNVREADGRKYLSITKQNVEATSPLTPLPADWVSITFAADLRGKDIELGSKPWDTPLVEVFFANADGKRMSDGAATLALKSDSDWERLEVDRAVPIAAKSYAITVKHKGKNGTFDVADMTITPTIGKRGAAAPAAEGELLPQGDFRGRDVPAGWKVGEPWMAEAFKVERDRLIARKVEGRDDAWIETTAPIDPKQHPKVRMHILNYNGESHRQERDEARRPDVVLTFEDAQGQDVGQSLRIPLSSFLSPSLQSIIGDVPSQAQQMRVRITYRAIKGQITLRDLHVVPATGDEPAWLQRPAKVPAGVQFAHTLPRGIDVLPPQSELDREPGANVDESKVKVVMRADANSGRPIHDVFAEAMNHLNKGDGVKVIVSGSHRIDEVLDLRDLTDAGREAVLVIEGEGDGAEIVGSQAWPLSEWQVVDAAKGVYRHAWPHDFGFHTSGYYNPPQAVLHRREMVFVNGQRLNQKLIEETRYSDGGKVYNSVGLVVSEDGGEKGYRYEGYKGPGILEAGEFGVAERDDHADANSIFIRVPAGTPGDAIVEVAIAESLLWTLNKSNLVLRNLVFRHAASVFNIAGHLSRPRAAISIVVEDVPLGPHDVLIESVRVVQNNGIGIENTGRTRQWEIRHSELSDNGNRGLSFNGYGVKITDTDIMRNLWRGGEYNWAGHGGGGVNGNVHGFVMQRCRVNDNHSYGLRFDVWGIDMLFEDCEFNRNTGGGMMHEIEAGPLVIRRTQVNDNGGAGVKLVNCRNVTIEDSQLIGNKAMAIRLYGMTGRSSPASYFSRDMEILDYVEDFVIRNTTIVTADDPKSLIVGWHHQGDPKMYTAILKEEYTGENNMFWSPVRRDVFEVTEAYNADRFVDLEGWQQYTGTDKTSRWAPPAK